MLRFHSEIFESRGRDDALETGHAADEGSRSLVVPFILGCVAIAVAIKLGGFDATLGFVHIVAKVLA